MLNRILEYIDTLTPELLELQRNLVAIPAMSPQNGGDGEKDKADWLKQRLAAMGITDVRDLNAPADDVSCGYRPNVAAILPGKDTSRTFWIISHIDIVPPGDPSLWKSDPYTLVQDGDLIMGRGVEDNQQGMVSSLLLAKSFQDLDVIPPINLGLLFVADEETGSAFGLDYVLREHGDIFGPNDLILVPDSGSSDGAAVEVAEKGQFWIKAEVLGKQCHASSPDQGINSLVGAADLILRSRSLYDRFNATDKLFEPSYSTFEATKKNANVENINTLPGRDVFYFDCRVLPQYDIQEVFDALRELADEVEKTQGVTIHLTERQKEQAATPTPVDSPIVQKIMAGVKKVYQVTPYPVGIGGGTVAAFLRRAGHSAVVWSRLEHNAHQPNETSSIASTLGDAKVMAVALLSDEES